MMRRWVFALVVMCWIGCGPSGYGEPHWSDRRPITLSLGENLPIESKEITRAISDGLREMGLSLALAPQLAPAIAVEYSTDCTCVGCNKGTAGFVRDPEFWVIQLCAHSATIAQRRGHAVAADVVAKHELGHVLGMVGHHAGVGMMRAELDAENSPRVFSDKDRELICSFGGIRSSVCSTYQRR